MGSSRPFSLLVIIGIAALSFFACGAEVTEHNAAEDQSTDVTATSTETANEPAGLSFARDVKPVLEANCVSCHSDAGPGTTHLQIATASDVASIAEFIAYRVEQKQMPPWPQSGLQEIEYLYDLSMSDADRQAIIDWANDGGTLDVAPETPLTATTQAYPPIDADLVVFADSPYPGSDKVDDYRCRILDPEFTETTWVTSIDTRPDETRVLHHSLIYHLPASDRAQADELDGRDGAPGWTCQTVPRLESGMLQQVAGWAPGTGPITMPDGSGLRMDPGDTFVVQWHYHYDAEALPDNSGIGIEIASADSVAAAGGELRPIHNTALLTPVEIPCATHESGPLCDRNAAVTRLAREFGFESAYIADFINRRCGVTADDFAHLTNGTATSTCDVAAPVGEIVSMWPHMHELGTTYRMTLNPGTPEETLLIDIDRWDFQWQMGYYPAEPLVFSEGDVLRIECGWDRSLWPSGLESRYILWAEGTQDEMCYTGVAYG